MNFYSITTSEYVGFAGSETKYFSRKAGFDIKLDAAAGVYLVLKGASRILIERSNVLYGLPELETKAPKKGDKPIAIVDGESKILGAE